MALALYRRYRPDTLQGVIGQDQVTVPLTRALDNNRLTNAYLFSGPRGCGKTSVARILARCANCEKGPTSHPCGECASCKELAANGPGSIDVVEIDAASHNSVEDARQIRERATFAPVRDRYKIFILDEAHMVTQQGFNALLKIVEEPPEHVMFIFATTEPDKVISTIRSRTHHYPFRLVPPEIMGPYLQKICAKEKITAEPGVLDLAMRAGGGSVRDTLSVLDQLMVGSQDGKILLKDASALLGFTPSELISGMVDSLIDHDGKKMYGIVEKVVVGGFEPRRFVEDLLAHLRDLLVLTLAGPDAVQSLGEEARQERSGTLSRQAKALGLAKLTRLADLTNDALSSMVGATSPRMKLELLTARLLEVMDGEVPQTARIPASGPAGNAGEGTRTAASGEHRLGLRPSNRQNARNHSVPSAPAVSTSSPSPSSSPSVSVPSAPSPNTAQAFTTTTSEGQAANASVQLAAANAETKNARAAAQTGNHGIPEKDAETNEQKWDRVLKNLPEDLSRYVDHDRVPRVEFARNRLGGDHLVLTFDKPLSQHVFALAVADDHQGVPRLVQNEVRKVFGPLSSIAPSQLAADGSIVRQLKSLSPDELKRVKTQIAMQAVRTKLPAQHKPEPAEGAKPEQKVPSAKSPIASPGVPRTQNVQARGQVQKEAAREESGDRAGSGAETGTQGADGSSGDGAAAHGSSDDGSDGDGGSTGAGPAQSHPAGSSDGFAAEDDGFASADAVGASVTERRVNPDALKPAAAHHHKEVPVPSRTDEHDPWADEPDLADDLSARTGTVPQNPLMARQDQQAQQPHQERRAGSSSSQPHPGSVPSMPSPAQSAISSGPEGPYGIAQMPAALAASASASMANRPAPRVAAEDDVYSREDSVVDSGGMLSLDQIRQIFDVTQEKRIPAPGSDGAEDQGKQEAKIVSKDSGK